MNTRQRIIVVAVFALIALLFVGSAVNGPSGGGDGAALRHPGGFIDWLGRRFATTPDADLADLSAACLSGDKLTVNDGTCTLKVARSDSGRGGGRRNVRLRTDNAVAVQAPAPGEDTLVRSDVEAGQEIGVAVDGDGADIDVICAGQRTCVLTVLRKE